MARVLRNEARVELSRQKSILETRRDALRVKLDKDHPYYPPRDRVEEIRKLSFKITQITKHINTKLRAF